MNNSRAIRKVSFSNFYCTKCGQKNFITIPRRKGQEREPGHLKKMYCFSCQEETNMVEVREGKQTYTLDMFFTEYYHGNFTPEGTRKEKNFRKFCSMYI